MAELTDTNSIMEAAKELRIAEDGLAFLELIVGSEFNGSVAPPLWAEVDAATGNKHLLNEPGSHVMNIVARKLREHFPEAIAKAIEDRRNTITMLRERIYSLVYPDGRQ